MNKENTEKARYTTEYVIAAGYTLFFCVVFTLGMAVYFWFIVQSRPSTPINHFATSLPPATPTPYFLLSAQQESTPFFEDDFSSDPHWWSGTDDSSKKKVELGKLVLESRNENSVAFATCDGCSYLGKPFYLEADLSTNTATDEDFGIYFNYDYRKNTYFLFQINTEARKYYFYHYSDDGWVLRAARESQQIKSFPAVNTIGIYADDDFIEFYVNGTIIDSYVQSGYPFYKGDFGFFLGDADFQLIVDNLVITSVGE